MGNTNKKAICIIENDDLHASITFNQKSNGTEITFDIKSNKDAGDEIHAIHIHEFGDLSNGCISTGSHYNPDNKNHGSIIYSKNNRHVGDLINNFQYNKITNRFLLTYTDSKVKVKDIIGRAIVIHKYPDDYGLKGQINEDKKLVFYKEMSLTELKQFSKERGYKTDNKFDKEFYVKKLNGESLKTGNAGGRIGCGVIGISK
jgi:Cu-Zn family superoxide dismutase